MCFKIKSEKCNELQKGVRARQFNHYMSLLSHHHINRAKAQYKRQNRNEIARASERMRRLAYAVPIAELVAKRITPILCQLLPFILVVHVCVCVAFDCDKFHDKSIFSID